MKYFVIVLLATLGTGATRADDNDWRLAWDGTLYGYAETTHLRQDSVVNPDNRFARIAENRLTGELRLNLKAESESLRLTARPILSLRQSDDGFQTTTDDKAWLSQWQARVRVAEGWHIAAGRDLLNWGPAQFKSPSSPFYFDNGRSDPMRELTGMDSAKISWTPDLQTSLTAAYIVGTGEGAEERIGADPWRHGWLAKLDRRGEDWAVGLVAAGSPEQGDFYGAHGQLTLSDAVLVYGEAGSSMREKMRRTIALLGTSYTFENGQSLAAEYLFNGHGGTRAQENAWFAEAAVAPGLALSRQPPLLGRDYLHLVWQSNLMDDRGYWRLMASHNLTDGSGELAAYGEHVLNRRLTAFALAVVTGGGARRELSAFVDNRLTIGLKIALP